MEHTVTCIYIYVYIYICIYIYIYVCVCILCIYKCITLIVCNIHLRYYTSILYIAPLTVFLTVPGVWVAWVQFTHKLQSSKRPAGLCHHRGRRVSVLLKWKPKALRLGEWNIWKIRCVFCRWKERDVVLYRRKPPLRELLCGKIPMQMWSTRRSWGCDDARFHQLCRVTWCPASSYSWTSFLTDPDRV